MTEQLWIDVLKFSLHERNTENAIRKANAVVNAFETRFHDKQCPGDECCVDTMVYGVAAEETPPAVTHRDVTANDVGLLVEVSDHPDGKWFTRKFVGFQFGDDDDMKYASYSPSDQSIIHTWEYARVQS